MQITQQRLRELLDYDPATGVFTWIDTGPGRKADKSAGTKSNAYGRLCVDGKVYSEHRLAWLFVHGTLPPMVDHINGDKHDNRIENLREATRSQNAANSKRRIDNRSGLKGVSKCSKTDKWVATIKVDGKSRQIGRYTCLAVASFAYQIEADKKFGEFAHGTPNRVHD